MELKDLVRTVAKKPKQPPLMEGEYEFAINRRAQKIVGTFVSLVTDSETVRVITGQPYSWRGETTLPDTSIGILCEVRCRVELSGAIPSEEAKARAFLERLLACDLNQDVLVQRALTEAIRAESQQELHGAFVNEVTTNASKFYRDLMKSMARAGLPVERLRIEFISYDPLDQVEFADEDKGLAVRTRGSLEESRFLFVARLVWGEEPEQIFARYAYRGTLHGRDSGPPLDYPLVEGQIQPAEAQFRAILTKHLGRQSFKALADHDMNVIKRVMADVSAEFGRATGRVLDTLRINLAASNRPSESRRPSEFEHAYRILGIRSGQLKIEHRFNFRIVERDKWLFSGSPDAEMFIRDEIIKATQVYLSDKTFEQVVGLYLKEGSQPDNNALVKAINASVEPAASRIGCQLETVASLLTIPQVQYVLGKEIRLPESEYQLADPNLRPGLAMAVRVRVRTEDGEKFARALARDDEFDKRLEDALDEVLRATLRQHGGLDYYSSPFVNHISRDQTFGSRQQEGAATPVGGLVLDEQGNPVAEPDDGASSGNERAGYTDKLQQNLMHALSTMLEDNYGLQVDGAIDLSPTKDRVITRMTEILLRPEPFEAILHFGKAAVTANARLFIAGLSRDYWDRFYRNVDRHETIKEHVDAVKELFVASLQEVETVLVGPRGTGIELNRALASAVQSFIVHLREDFGLEVNVHTMRVKAERPRVGASEFDEMHIESLKAQARHALVKAQEAMQQSDPSEAAERRSAAMAEYGRIREEMDELTERVEGKETETVVLEVKQDRISGPIHVQPALEKLSGAAATGL